MAEVRELTEGRGADVVVDSVGEQTWSGSLRALRRGGRLVVCGATTGPMVSLDLRRLFWHQWSILGSTLGSRREYAEIVEHATAGRLWPVIDRVVPLEEGPAAFRAAAARRAGRQTRHRGRTVNELWERIQVGAEQIGNVLPALVGAAVILLTGYFLAVQIQRWADDTLKRMDFNRMATAGGLDQAVVRTGSRLDPVRALTKLLFWLVMLVVILLASTALGLESINEMFGAMLAFIPTLIAAIVIVILGIIVGEFVRGLIVASAGGLAGVPTVAKLAKGAVILISLFMALQQVGVAEEIVTAAFTLILGAAALAVGLAFGLGNRELAGEITRRWYEEGQRRDRRTSDPSGPNAPPGSEPPILD